MLVNNKNNQNNYISYIKNRKFLFGAFGGLSGSSTLALIAKLIYDKFNNTSDSIKLNINDNKFIIKNFFLCKWGKGTNLCWNDVLIQLLMLPDIRCEKYNSAKINTIINWINEILGEKYNGNCLNRQIAVPLDVRPISDGHESRLTDGGFYNIELFEKFDGLYFDKMVNLKNYVIVPPFADGSGFMLPNNCSCRRYMAVIGDIFNPITKSWDTNKIFYPKAQGYYPTFIIVYDDVNTDSHWHVYYVIYDKTKEVKYFLWVNDLENSMYVLKKNEVLEELKKFKQVMVVYSCSNIIEKYYII